MLDLDTFRLRASSIYSESTVKRKLVALREYDRFLESKGLQPGVESLSLWLDELARRGMSSNTIASYAYDVISYFEIMMVDVDEKKLRLLKKRIPPRPVREADFLTDEEVAALIKKTPSPVRRLIYALCYTYARRLGEVLALKWRDIDLDNNTITFTILKKKAGEKATYELEPWIKDMLLKYRDILGKDRLFEISARAVEIAFKKDCRRAGIRPNGRRLVVHILRHSRITSLRSKGVPLDVISKYIARHSRFDTTIQYYRGVTEEEKLLIPKASDVLGV